MMSGDLMFLHEVLQRHGDHPFLKPCVLYQETEIDTHTTSSLL